MGSLQDASLGDTGPNEILMRKDGVDTHVDLLKKQNISATRDFQRGCGGNASNINQQPLCMEPVASSDGGEKKRTDTETVNPNNSELLNISVLQQLVKNLVKTELTDSIDVVVGKLVNAACKANGFDLSSLVEPKPLDGLKPEPPNKSPKTDNYTVTKMEDARVSKTMKDEILQGDAFSITIKSNESTETKTVSEIGHTSSNQVPGDVPKQSDPPQSPVITNNILGKNSPGIKFHRRRVSAIRDYPPFCGRNAPCLTEEKRFRIISRSKASGDGALQAKRSNELKGAAQDDDLKKRKLEGQSEFVPETMRSALKNNSVTQEDVLKKRNLEGQNRFVPETMMSVSKNNLVTQEDLLKKRNLEGQSRFVPETMRSALKNNSVTQEDVLKKRNLEGQSRFVPEMMRSVSKNNLVSASSKVATKNNPLFHGKASNSSKGAHDVDMRTRVRETLDLFHSIYERILQGEGEQSIRRIDLEADKIVKRKGKTVNTEKQWIGSVPGVEVGDEYIYRIELSLVGLHRPPQSGIDYMKRGSVILATSIVASGGYDDDLANSDVLTYSGHGGKGKDKQPEDQKLEKGNLALKNSIAANTPVRVIRGLKDTEISTKNGRPKPVTKYTYDGLYTVEKYWRDVGMHGKVVFMFELRRIPGQPKVAWRKVKY